METEVGIEEVIATYTKTVYGVALTHTASRADADDVFQEVFTAYWRSKPGINSEEHRKAWLIRTTLNFCLKITQGSWAQKTVPFDDSIQLPLDPTVELPSADASFRTEQQEALYAAVCALPTNYRTVVQLFYFEDMSIAQIADTLQEEQGTVKTRLSRARAQLREKLKAGNSHD